MNQASYSHRPVLAANDTDLVRRLNRDYLDLLAATYEEDGPLAPGVMRDLIAADDLERNAMAACPYSLFAMELPEITADSGAASQVQDFAERPVFPSQRLWAPFATTAWFFAWYLSRSNPLSARFIVGLNPGQTAVLADFAPWQLRRLVALQSGAPAPRWRANPCFWPELVRLARSGQPLRLTAAHLLGVQLLAAESDPQARRGGHVRLRGP